MTRNFRRFALATFLCLAGVSTSAMAQYPPGYGGYGWHGWGGGSGSGRTAAGMGVFANGAGNAAAGVGQRNVDNAQARSMNAQTAMGVNNYLWECNQRNLGMYQQRLAQQQVDNVKALSDIQDRILNHPNEIDIANGDSLNALMGVLTNPLVYSRTLELAQKPINSATIKRIPFEYAAGGIVYSIGELTDRDNIPEVYNRPEFTEQRKAVRALVAQIQKDTAANKAPKSSTVKKLRTDLNGIKATLETLNISGDERLKAERYVKALLGLAKMIDSPSFDIYLAAVDQVPETPLCEVLIFMHAFNLQFGPSKDPETREMYSILFGQLSELRQQLNAPPEAAQAAQVAQTTGPKRDDRVTNFYSNMPYEHLNAPNAPAPGRQ